MRATRITGIAVLSLAFAACSQAPTVDIDAANHAVDQARRAQAAEYAPASWTAAQDAEAKLQIELDTQAQRWAPLRSYTVARQLALDTQQAAERSRDEAVTGKEQAKTEASTLMLQAREESGRAHAAIATAPKGKGTAVDLASLKADATGIDDTLLAMQQAFDASDYNNAKSKAQAAIDAAKRIQTEIEQVKAQHRST